MVEGQRPKAKLRPKAMIRPKAKLWPKAVIRPKAKFWPKAKLKTKAKMRPKANNGMLFLWIALMMASFTPSQKKSAIFA